MFGPKKQLHQQQLGSWELQQQHTHTRHTHTHTRRRSRELRVFCNLCWCCCCYCYLISHFFRHSHTHTHRDAFVCKSIGALQKFVIQFFLLCYAHMQSGTTTTTTTINNNKSIFENIPTKTGRAISNGDCVSASERAKLMLMLMLTTKRTIRQRARLRLRATSTLFVLKQQKSARAHTVSMLLVGLPASTKLWERLN